MLIVTDPFHSHTSVVQPIHAMLQNAHAATQHGGGHRRGYAVVSVRHCTCARVPLFPNMHIFVFDMTMG